MTNWQPRAWIGPCFDSLNSPPPRRNASDVCRAALLPEADREVRQGEAGGHGGAQERVALRHVPPQEAGSGGRAARELSGERAFTAIFFLGSPCAYSKLPIPWKASHRAGRCFPLLQAAGEGLQYNPQYTKPAAAPTGPLPRCFCLQQPAGFIQQQEAIAM